jgi:hypothetical protein
MSLHDQEQHDDEHVIHVPIRAEPWRLGTSTSLLTWKYSVTYSIRKNNDAALVHLNFSRNSDVTVFLHILYRKDYKGAQWLHLCHV